MTPKINFTPGPSQLYFTAEDHMRKAFKDGIPSLSHRSKQFESIYIELKEGLKSLLNIPSNFHIVFSGSATELWERGIQNLVEHQSHHLVNGAFSKRFFEIADQIGKHPVKTEVNAGQGFDFPLQFDSPEFIALTQNETSTGVSISNSYIEQIRHQYPDALIMVDAVSSLPYPDLDFNKIDSVFFSVQKGFGLPAGLGVWIVNDKCIAKSEYLLSKGISIGSYHSLPSLITHAQKNQTPETPNVLGIYLLSKIVQDMLRRGITIIRKETEYKAAILYQLLESNQFLSPFVKDKSHQSKTVIVAECGEYTDTISHFLLEKGIQPGEGYGALKKLQLRFANFPAHSKEQVELLVDTLAEFKL